MPGGVRHRSAIEHRVLGYRAVQVLGYVRQVIDEEGRAPSYGMICSALGLDSKRDVCRVVQSLERRGLISRVGQGRVRRIRLVGAN